MPTHHGCGFGTIIEQGCQNISKDSVEMTPNQQTGLCTVCERVGFIGLTETTCPEYSQDNRGMLAQYHIGHYHLGPLRHVLRKTFCPGCRLISHAVLAFGIKHDVIDNTTIELRPGMFQFLDLDREEPIDAQTNHVGQLWLDVALNREDRQLSWMKGASTRITVVKILRDWQLDIEHLAARGPHYGEAVDLHHIRSRTLSPKVDADQIKQWMHVCTETHPRCRTVEFTAAIGCHIRLVDVEKHQIVTASLETEFLALSYVWGPTNGMLTKDVLSRYSEPYGLQSAIIPRTISDTMQFVSDIGKRYLWVDSLCIIQDDDDDKFRQLPIMANVYNCAILVIVAAAGRDANAGLPGLGVTQRRISHSREVIDGQVFKTLPPDIQDALTWSIWNTRGWTFQEAILSHKAVIFTERQVYWCCRTATWREDVVSEFRKFAAQNDSFWKHQFAPQTCRNKSYCHTVEMFSDRRFKNDEDIFWAFSGVLKLQASRFQQGFIWALPYESLDIALLWYKPTVNCSSLHTRLARHIVRKGGNRYSFFYPSWSWLSTLSGVTFVDHCGDSVLSEVTWHDPIKLGSEDSAPYLSSICTKNGTDQCELQEYRDLISEASPSLGIMDYGLLKLNAQTANLTLIQVVVQSAGEDGTGSEKGSLGYDIPYQQGNNLGNVEKRQDTLSGRRAFACIESHAGKTIGLLEVPLGLFGGRPQCSGEFVLLSSNANKHFDEICRPLCGDADCEVGCNIRHVTGCKHITSHNIMLISRVGNVAYRQGLCTVWKTDWQEVDTTEKTIILG